MGLEAGGHCRLRGGGERFQLRDCYQVYTLQLCKLQPGRGSGKSHPDFYTALSLSVCQLWEGASHRAHGSRATAHREAPAALGGAQGELHTAILTTVNHSLSLSDQLPFP